MSKTAIDELMDEYQKSREALGAAFGIDIWYNIIDNREFPWEDVGDGAKYMDNGEIYSFEQYGSKFETDTHVLYIGDNGCGDRDMYLFSKDKETADIED